MNTVANWIPVDNTELWAALPARAKTRVEKLFPICCEAAQRMNGERKRFLTAAAQELSALYLTIGETVVRLPASYSALKRLFAQWNNGTEKFEARSWKHLVDAWDLPEAPRSQQPLPAAFIAYWQTFVVANKRKTAPAYKALIRAWARGEEIKGYAIRPEADPKTGIPAGWGYRNLTRPCYMPTPLEIKAHRIGITAASEHRPLVFNTRVGLQVGQYYLFDDFWHDFKVNVVGQRKAQRLLQFHVLDLFSGCNFARGMKAVREDEMTGAQERLKEKEMLFLTAYTLCRFGYRPSGTDLIVEAGTATLREVDRERIHRLTNKCVNVQIGATAAASAFAGAYAGSSKGNFHFKAALESFGNLLHNESADSIQFPGQTGSNSRINAPEELAGRDHHNNLLLRAIAAMPRERAELLRLPFLEFNQAVRLVTEIHERINERIDHNLEGFIEAGLVENEFRLGIDQPWLSASRIIGMDDKQRAAIAAIIDCDPHLINTRKLSPKEVFNRGASQLIRLPVHSVPELLGMENGTEVSVRNNMIEFSDKMLNHGEPMRFEPVAVLRGGVRERFRDGSKFLAFLNPLDLSQLHLCNSQGGYIGSCPAWEPTRRDDIEGFHRQCGRSAKALKELLAPVARQGAAITRQRIADNLHNIQVLGNAPLTTEEKAAKRAIARRVSKETGSIEDLIPGNGSTGALESAQQEAPAIETDDISALL